MGKHHNNHGKHHHKGDHNHHKGDHHNNNNHHNNHHKNHHRNQEDDASNNMTGNNQAIVDFLAPYHIGFGAAQLAAAQIGTDGNDTLTGGNKRGDFLGFDGDDVITGSTKGDGIFGGAGNDILTGGGGEDAFIFGVGDGHDIITDINLSDTGPSDIVRLHSFDGAIPMSSKEEFLDNYASQVGDSVFFTLNENDSIEFQNAQLADFYANSGNICLWFE